MKLRRRFWIEVGLGVMAGVLTLATVLVHDWAEVLFHVDPDHGSGAIEIGATLIALFVTAAVLSAAGREGWRRGAIGRAG